MALERCCACATSACRVLLLTHIGEAGLLQERRAGTKRLYTVRPEALNELRDFIDGFWEPRLRRLKHAAEALERSKKVR